MENQIILISSMVLGITSIAGATGLPSRLKPIFALLIGVALALFTFGLSRSVAVTGIISSLSAMGLWAGTTSTTKKVSNEDLTSA